MMKRVCTPVAAHRRRLSKGVVDTVSWLSQSTHIFTKFNEVILQLQGNGVNLIKAKSAIFTFLSKFNAVQTKSSPPWTLTVSKFPTAKWLNWLNLSFLVKCIFALILVLKPFNDHVHQQIGARFFGYNSPAAIAKELFNLRMRQVFLVLLKNFFDLGEGFVWERLAKWGCFGFFDQLWRALDNNPMSQNFGLNLFCKLDDLPRR